MQSRSPNGKLAWDAQRRELRLGGRLLKCYRQPAQNQVCILETFQELGWPARIDNPLPNGDDVDAHDRLHDTVRRLNNHAGRAILFHCDGLGKGITWELRPKPVKETRPSSAQPAPKKRPRSAP